MNRHPNPDELLDAAVDAVRDEAVDPQLLAAARERVARRLAAELDGPAGAGAEHRIRGCEGFRGLIPAYLAGALADAAPDPVRGPHPRVRAVPARPRGRPSRRRRRHRLADAAAAPGGGCATPWPPAWPGW
jgi:hypothetical protein